MKKITNVFAITVAVISALLIFNGALRLLNMASDIAVTAGVLIIVALGTGAYFVVKPSIARLFERTRNNGDWIPALLVAFVVVNLTGCYKVIEPGHVGIKVEQTGADRGVSNTPVSTGRVFYNPVNEYVLNYPTSAQRAIWTSSTSEGRPSNEEIAFQSLDGLHFTGDVAVAYQLEAAKVPAFYVKFRSDDLDTWTHGFFRDAVRKAIGESAHQFTAEEINGGKQAQMENDAQEALSKAVSKWGVNIIQLAFTSPPRPPASVRSAIEGKIAATQKAEQIQNEKAQAIAEGQKIEALAQAQASANQVIRQSITPELVQWRELDMLEKKWNGQLPMVQGGIGGGVMLNLPGMALQKRQ